MNCGIPTISDFAVCLVTDFQMVAIILLFISA